MTTLPPPQSEPRPLERERVWLLRTASRLALPVFLAWLIVGREAAIYLGTIWAVLLLLLALERRLNKHWPESRELWAMIIVWAGFAYGMLSDSFSWWRLAFLGGILLVNYWMFQMERQVWRYEKPADAEPGSAGKTG